MDPTNEKVSNNHILDDLVFSILSKLPLKSLRRFTCVCKSWSLLFQNPHLMTMLRNYFIYKHHSFYDNTCLLLKQIKPSNVYDCTLYMLSGERFENKVKLDWSPLLQEDNINIGFDILGSGINGILCLCQGYYNPKVVLWNPATEEFKVIPRSLVESVHGFNVVVSLHGFGYDHVRDDYKVIRHVDFLSYLPNFEGDRAVVPMRPDPLWEIYNTRNNSWRKLDDVNMPLCSPSNVGVEVHLNGVCHWWGETCPGEAYVVSFDLSNEVYFITPIPSDIITHHHDVDDFGYVWVVKHLVVLNESIALISNYTAMTSFHISILGELGIEESWTKLFVVGPLPCVEHPIGVGKKGDIFFRKNDDELVWFDLSTQRIEEIGVKGMSLCCKIVIYKENLLPIGGINN